ncbi:hypothetical protein F4804DRAFT_148321 [Jackrogersella minutella]|nr:hypothetical protein F4804DRAFT_148321 [Jackrogersella minutella]
MLRKWFPKLYSLTSSTPFVSSVVVRSASRLDRTLPMLEKTAASLEPSGFHRVVPNATQSLRSTRHLRAAFWQHGATEIELTAAWQALMHGTFDLNMGPTPEETKGTSLSASACLLDFLYPTGAVTIMRHLATTTPASRSRSSAFRHGQPFAKLTPRLYTSSLPRRQADRPKTDLATGQEAHEEPGSDKSTNDVDSAGSQDAEVAGTDNVPDLADGEIDQDAGVEAQLEDTPVPPDVAVNDIDYPKVDNPAEALDSLLKHDSDDPKDADRVWHYYRILDEPSQTIFMQQVLVFLLKGGRLSHSWKISELFQKLPSSQWTNQIFVAGITAEINLQNDNQAIDALVKGAEKDDIDVTSLIDALDLLLSNALRSSSLSLLKRIWKHYATLAARLDFEGIMSQLRHVASVPGLAAKAFEFQTRTRQELQELDDDGDDTRLSDEALDWLQKILTRRALLSCADDQVIPLLNLTEDLHIYEEFLRTVIRRGKEKLGIEVYKIYRDLPGSMPSHPVLHEIFKAYNKLHTPLSTKYAGLELLWGDWHKFHTQPSRRAFQRYLAFYASHGDKDQVYKLWPQLIKLYRDDPQYPVLEGQDTFSHLLQVHAVRGESQEAQRIFDDIEGKFRIKPSTFSWNILLNAYVKASDYESAISTFEKLTETGDPDHYSYATMMQMSGTRGDLGFTIDLYRQARNNNLQADEAMLSSLVDAYCQNNHLQAAEDICSRAVRKGIVVTRMWNKLIRYHALRRDLASVNKVLGLMADKDVPFNQFTYQQLLLGLALCRQSQHALALLSAAVKDKIFDVAAEHFHIVMGALLVTGEPAAVQRLHRMMMENGFSSSAHSLYHLSRAIAQWKNMPHHQRMRHKAKDWLGTALRSFYNIYGLDSQKKLGGLSAPTPKPGNPGELLGESAEKYHFSTMVYMLVELKDFVQARELIDLYRFIFQGRENASGVLPVFMLNSLMLADFHQKHYDRVKVTWNILYEAAKKEARSADFVEDLPHTPKISPKYHYVLSGGLEVMMKVLFIEEDAAGIKNLIADVRREGFNIDSKNWNSYIQLLVQLKEYKDAFVTCERVLMPNWTGWYRARRTENVRDNLPLDLRRKGASPRYLRPLATTLYRLAHGYMELDNIGPWSSEAVRTTREIERECVQVVRAIKSMTRVYSSLEYEILGEEDYIATLPT